METPKKGTLIYSQEIEDRCTFKSEAYRATIYK